MLVVDKFMIGGIWVMSILRIRGYIWLKSEGLSILCHGNVKGEA